jgi:zearalenone synthase (highly reducing iterative type I polyketide synthase)
MGQIPDPFIGVEAAGIVRRAGTAVSKFQIGDKVAILGHGAHSTSARTRASNCALIPEGMTFEQAATVPTVHGTAWYALVHLARIRQGQTILIHAAAGGVGQAAIQVAKHFDLEIFATVSTPAKRQLIRDAYGIPNDHIFNSRDLSFVKGIKRITQGRGVDVVLNSLSGEALRQTWHCIAPFGYFIEIGLRDILSNTGLDMAPFKQDATFTFLNLDHVQRKRPDLMIKILEGAFNFFRKGISTPIVPITTYPISEVEQAFRLMQAGKHIGKLVLTWGDDDVVPVLEGQKKPLKLDPNAVYILVGGLGGLGRSLSMRLVHLGARKLCFFSRSGARSTAAKDLVHDLETQDVEVKALLCDITSETAVAAAVAECSQELGPIRGVFQCAMVLRDSLFAKMTHQQWLEATQPKIQGSWNLHKHLPNVDFFITLSSCVATFGNRGQSNYSAGGSYEDALAYYRRSLGLPATTVDLGIMREIGVLAETGMTDNLKDWDKPYGIGEAEFHALMEVAMEADIKGTRPAQIITGLATGGSAFLAGIDPPYYLDNALFRRMALTGLREAQGDSASNDASGPIHARLAQVESLDDAAGIVTEALVKQIARMLQMPADEIDTTRFLHNYGIDSLLAIEVVNWALKEAKSTVNVIDVLSSIPITALSRRVATKSVVVPKELAQE